jgi:hypothetical protein
MLARVTVPDWPRNVMLRDDPDGLLRRRTEKAGI